MKIRAVVIGVLCAVYALVAYLITPPADAKATNPITVTSPYIAVPAPLYGATYSSAQQPVATDNSAEILAEIKAIRALLERFVGPAQGDNIEAEKLASDVTVLVKTKCASCHNSQDAGKKGGDFVLYIDDKTPVKLSRPDSRAIIKRTKDGTMPPPDKGKLTDDEKKILESFFK